MAHKLRWRISKKQAGMGLLQFLREQYTDAPSVKAIKRAIDGKRCVINKQIETFSSYKIEEGDVVELTTLENAHDKIVSPSVLYEDEELLVINKPSGIVCESKSIYRHLEIPSLLIHRLDRETTGALLLAKNASTQNALIAQFKQRTVRKMYLAIVDGVISKASGTIDNFLGKIKSYEGQTIYGSVLSVKGQRAVTHWKCVKRGKTASLLCCEPHTGRTHQLRAHLQGLGHPILGDCQYGKKFLCPYKPRRNLLHAYRLTFFHPHLKKEMALTAPIPADFKSALDELIP